MNFVSYSHRIDPGELTGACWTHLHLGNENIPVALKLTGFPGW